MTRIADYELLDTLGRGNHGIFYRARPPARLGLDTDVVALKVLDRNAADSDYSRLATELRVFASVNSEFLVRLLDAGHQAGRLFYAMTYYEEGSLAQDGHSPQVIMRAIADAARGAHALHEIGVVHRDIKPANVLLESGRGRLADLGLAQLWSPGATTTGIGPIGSIEYMEPDVIYGERAERSSDVWSLGMTVHRCLTGHGCYGPIPVGSVLESFRHILHERPVIHSALTGAVRDVVTRAISEHRMDRYPTANAFADDLEQAGGLR